MNKTLSFVRLDFLTVKPYMTLKNLIIFVAVSLVMIMTSGTSAGAIGMLMFYSSLYVSYPFAVGEQNGIDALYITLSIKRNTVVLGRYLFALTVDICSGVFAYAISFAMLTLLKKDFGAWESLLTTLAVFLIYSVLQAIQLPIFFKLGYTKAKLLAYLPLVGLPVAVLLFANMMKDSVSAEQIYGFFDWFAANRFAAAIVGAVIWLGIMLVSYKASLAYYNKRDF